MSAENWGALILVLLGFSLACAAGSWATKYRLLWSPAALTLLLAAGVLAAAPPEVTIDGRGLTTLLVVLAGLLAITGGGPLTALVFDAVDRREIPHDDIDRAAQILRGGMWIGVLERVAIFATLVAGWPEGVAIALGVKGLGRYPELRAPDDGAHAGVAERFIIGTLTSVLWAAACAGVVMLVA
jgi:hypothetical protein